MVFIIKVTLPWFPNLRIYDQNLSQRQLYLGMCLFVATIVNSTHLPHGFMPPPLFFSLNAIIADISLIPHKIVF